VRCAPVILQEYIPGVDVRVTVVGRRLFCASIDCRHTGSPEDFRLALDESRVEPIRLPPPLRRRLLALIRGLDLRYAAIDLRRSESGDWIFLEVNPSGQWLFVEARTGLPITDAVARLLATGR
jgi:glutathione synthase/RimK-type ligase-like ATP-grasp enzyme